MKKATITLSVVLATHLMADTVKLSEVTVSSASGYEQKITDAPASISVVTNEELQQKKVCKPSRSPRRC